MDLTHPERELLHALDDASGLDAVILHVERIIAERVAAAKAEALREAADAYGPAQISGFFPGRDGYAKAWLRDRANRITT